MPPQKPARAKGRDRDRDGLTDAEEREFGSDPRKADTDGDGVDDRMEWLIQSDPNNADSDGDNLPDGEELATDLGVNNPDTDGDGVIDGDEVIRYRSNPYREDSDKDGLRDGVEVAIGTSLTSDDSDGDDISDGLEIGKGLNPLVRHSPEQAKAINDANREPTLRDTINGDKDRDGYGDWVERLRGTDVDDSRSAPPLRVYDDAVNPGAKGAAVEPPEVDPFTGERVATAFDDPFAAAPPAPAPNLVEPLPADELSAPIAEPVAAAAPTYGDTSEPTGDSYGDTYGDSYGDAMADPEGTFA